MLSFACVEREHRHVPHMPHVAFATCPTCDIRRLDHVSRRSRAHAGRLTCDTWGRAEPTWAGSRGTPRRSGGLVSTPCGNADTCGAGRPTRLLLGNPVHQHDRISRVCMSAAHCCSSFRAREGLTSNVADNGTLCAGEKSHATAPKCSLLCVDMSEIILNFTSVIADLIGYRCIHVRNACHHQRSTRLTEVVKTDRLTDQGCSYGS